MNTYNSKGQIVEQHIYSSEGGTSYTELGEEWVSEDNFLKSAHMLPVDE